MRNKVLVALAAAGVLFAIIAAYQMATQPKSLPPAFAPASNPFGKGIYANGMIEASQATGTNVNLYPEVAGRVVAVFVRDGDIVKAGASLLQLDDRAQRATTAQLRAQVDVAQALLKNAEEGFAKLQVAADIDPRAVSRDAIDNGRNLLAQARAALAAAQQQYDAANVQLSKYRLKAPAAGTVLAVPTAVGSYLAPSGGYNGSTGGYSPAVVMGDATTKLSVRAYVDEILIQRLPDLAKARAVMSLRGSDRKIPLQFVRIQPLVSPKIELSNQRTEQVDVRVLPVLFSVEPPAGLSLYPGQQVDVFIAEEAR